MPIEVRAIQERRQTCELEMGEAGSVRLEYRPVVAERVLTQDAMTALSEANAGKPEGEQRRAVADLFVSIVAAWDVTEDGQPFPLDAARIASTFDGTFLGLCMAVIIQHANAGKVNGEVSRTLGIVTTLPMAEAPTETRKASPARTAAEASRQKSKSQKSPPNRASRRGNLRSMSNGSPSLQPA